MILVHDPLSPPPGLEGAVVAGPLNYRQMQAIYVDHYKLRGLTLDP